MTSVGLLQKLGRSDQSWWSRAV